MLARLSYQGIPIWRHVQILQWTYQIVSAIAVVTLVCWFFINIANAIQEREIPYGFSFLDRAYQTPIGQHFIPYQSSDTFLYAFVVAVTNTLIVSITGVILATALGIVIGVARLSTNWIVARLAMIYIGWFRNVPLVIQLFFWFYLVLTLPPVREGYVIGGEVFVNNAGLSLPWPAVADGGAAAIWLSAAVAAIFAGVAVYRRRNRRELETGVTSYPILYGFGTTVVIGALAWIIVGAAYGTAPLVISHPGPPRDLWPYPRGHHLLRRTDCLADGIGDLHSVVHCRNRAGRYPICWARTDRGCPVVGTPRFNHAPARDLSQALRVIMPPLISQWLNLTKNSSLAGAIGYSDLTNVAKTMTQTAPAVSIFILLMLAYLAMSLTWSLVGNLYNRRISFSGG